MTIHFKADLKPIVGERVGMLHWITDPACSGFIIAYDLGGNQVLISNFDVRTLSERKSRALIETVQQTSCGNMDSGAC